MNWRMTGVFCVTTAIALLTGFVFFQLTTDISWGLWGAVSFAGILLVLSGIFGPRYRRWLTGSTLDQTYTFPHLLRRAQIMEAGWRIAAPLLGMSMMFGFLPSMTFIPPDTKLTVSVALFGATALVMAGYAVAAYGFVRRPHDWG